MRHPLPFRLATFLLACLVALAGPGDALAHGWTHAHLAHAHAHAHAAHAHAAVGAARHVGEQVHADERPANLVGVDPASDPHGDRAAVQSPAEHAHGHATLVVVSDPRGFGRPDVLAAPATTSARPLAPTAVVVIVRSAAVADHALLARPDPGSGPPPRLRAPPVG